MGWSQEHQKNENENQTKQRKKKEKQNTSTLVEKKLTKDLEPKTESVLTYKEENQNLPTEGENSINPEERFEDVTDWEAFDNLAKEHGIPTLADLKKGEIHSAYLIKTDYITEPEPHPYQEVLEKESFPEKKDGKNINEDRSPNIWQRNKEDTKKPEVTNLKVRVPNFWRKKKVDTKKQEQKQNKMENSECEHCNKEFVSKERLRVHKSVCEKNTFMKIEPRKIEKVITIKNTEDNIEIQKEIIKKQKNKEDIIIKDDKKISQESTRKTDEEALKIKRNEEI